MGRNLGKALAPPLARMLEVFKCKDLAALAEAIGQPATTVRNWHTRNNVPTEWLLYTAQKTGASVDWLLTGESKQPKVSFLAGAPLPVKKNVVAPTHLDGPAEVNKLSQIRRDTAHLPVQHEQAPYEVTFDDVNAKPFGVPLLDISASAGNGHGEQEPTELMQVYFAPAYMRRHFGRAGNGFAMIYVKGDSMAPTLLDGEEIVIDMRVRRVDRDGIYVVTLRNDLKVKRIQIRLDGSLLVKSDNAAYDPETVNSKDADQFQVEGRLVWPRLR